MTTSFIPVLDHGFVALESVMGSDLTVVNAARVSFAKDSVWLVEESPGEWVKDDGSMLNMEFAQCNVKLQDSDTRLIRYLAWHDHWTPFGHPQITLRLKMPIFVARQWMRSNVGIVYNEVSRRYVDGPVEMYVPHEWRKRADAIKQGSAGVIDSASAVLVHMEYEEVQRHAGMAYQEALAHDVAPEQARISLPLSMYTEFWMTASLAALARVVGLRLDSHAQWEVRQYAQVVDWVVKPHFPVSWEELLRVSRETAQWRANRYKEIKG